MNSLNLKKIKIFSLFFLLFFLFPNLAFSQDEDEITSSSILKGHISNKRLKPIKLKICGLDESKLMYLDRNLDDFSLVPEFGLKVEARATETYTAFANNHEISIPKHTKLIGHISDVTDGKYFNRRGYYQVDFDKVVCPGGEVIDLKANITSKSLKRSYDPVGQLAKTSLGVVTGGLIGAVVAYKILGLAAAVGSKGYTIAGGAAVGGTIGGLIGLASKGKDSHIGPGEDLNIIPIGDESIDKLAQISCPAINPSQEYSESTENDTFEITKDIPADGIDLSILKVKRNKTFFGEQIRVDLDFKNNTEEILRLSRFVLRDSLGKEYTPSLMDVNSDPFQEIKPNQKLKLRIDYLVEFPKDDHWLILKSNNYSEDLGKWKVLISSSK